MSNSCEI